VVLIQAIATMFVQGEDDIVGQLFQWMVENRVDITDEAGVYYRRSS
jgi:hypothetical protein